LRNKPEDFNLLPDGEFITSGNNHVKREENWRLKDAQKTSFFWVFLFSRAAHGALGTGFVFHQLSIFAQIGHSPSIVAITFSVISFITAGTSLYAGHLIDNWKPGKIIALQLTSLALSLGIAMIMRQYWIIFIFSILMGFMKGTGNTFDGAVWANLYGRKYLGEIRRFVATFFAGSTALGPVLFGLSYDYTGSYSAVLWFGIVWSVIGAVASLKVDHSLKSNPQIV
jgi:cyanate permease